MQNFKAKKFIEEWKKNWDVKLCFYMSKDIDDIIYNEADSVAFKKFLELQHHEKIDSQIIFLESLKISDLFEIFINDGISKKGKYRKRRKLTKSDYKDNFVYKNFKDIISDEDFWSYGRNGPQLKLDKEIDKIFDSKKRRIRRIRKNYLEIMDEKYRSFEVFKKRSFFDLDKKQKKKREDLRLDGHINILFDLKDDSDLVGYLNLHGNSYETEAFDIYYPSYSSEKPFNKSLNNSFNFSFEVKETVKKGLKRQSSFLNNSDIKIFNDLQSELQNCRVMNRVRSFSSTHKYHSFEVPEVEIIDNYCFEFNKKKISDNEFEQNEV